MSTLDRWRAYMSANSSIVFPTLELISGQDGEAPIATGTGEVRMPSLDQFEYSLNGTAVDTSRAMHAMREQRENPYDGFNRFRLIGVDDKGTRWSGGWTVATVHPTAQRWQFAGEISALSTTDECGTGANSVELVFAFPIHHPIATHFARYVFTDQVAESSLSECSREILGSNIHFIYDQQNGYLSVTATTSQTLQHPYLENWLSEPFRILFGHPIYPRLVARNFATGKSIVWIRQSPSIEHRTGFAALWHSDEIKKDKATFWSLYDQILETIALARDDAGAPNFEANKITQLYDEVFQAQQGSRWVWGLTLASTMEGLIQMFVPKGTKRPDSDSNEIVDLTRHISTWKGDQDLKDAATRAVHRTTEATTAYLLRRLVATGVIEEAHRKAWNKIRNSVMHGNLVLPWSTQEEDDRLLALAEATHRLTIALVRKHQIIDEDATVSPSTLAPPHSPLGKRLAGWLSRYFGKWR